MNIGFVPVRGASKGISGKNIKDFCGKPLLWWVLNALCCSDNIDIVYVATEDINIKKISLGFGFDKVKIYNREQENATDTASTESVMLEFIKKMNFCPDDCFILAQATSPFTTKEDIDNAMEQFLSKKTDSLVSCCRVKRFFWSEDGVSQNYDYKNRPRRQDFSGNIMENGAFYINTVGNIVRDRNRLSGKIAIYEMEDVSATEIDEQIDWVIAEALMYKRINSSERNNIKLFATDVDGVLTDAGMYYSESGEELKKFNTHDGKGFELLRNCGIRTAIITSENTKIVENRATKLKVDYLYQGVSDKLSVVKKIAAIEGISLNEIAYIGDDINDKSVLDNVGFSACPLNAVHQIKSIPKILRLSKSGGFGVVREFIDYLLEGL